MLGLQKPALKIFKQVREVKDTEIVGEVFKENDEITVFDEDYEIERVNSNADAFRRGIHRQRNIINLTNEVVVLVLMRLTGHNRLFVPGDMIKCISFGLTNFTNKLELYR